MQDEILEPHPEADIAVYAVWFNMLFTDQRSRWDEDLLSDDRAIHFWDEPKEVGSWYARQGAYPFGTVAWDIYFLYGREAVWTESPEPLVSSGFPVIGQSAALMEALQPYLRPADSP